MCQGEIIYCGKPEDIPIHFGTLGYPVPPNTNPSDHLMSILNIDDIRIQDLEKGEKHTEKEVLDKFYERLSIFVAAFHKSEEIRSEQLEELA